MMLQLAGKTAFITGGASGIGLALGEAFGRQGMNVMLADIESEALKAAAQLLRSKEIKADGVVVDVALRESLQAAALATEAAFGKIHLVCNNAGVVTGGSVGEVPAKDWDWILDVNLKGVVNGMDIFLPFIERHGEGGHFLNTASINGMINTTGLEPYAATKFAVVAMSEGWAVQLEPRNIGLSILCPGMVASRIVESRRNRPTRYGEVEAGSMMESVADSAMAGIIPAQLVAARAVEAVLAGELYVFTHVEYKAALQARFDAIIAAFEKSENSPALASLGSRKEFEALIPL